MAAAVAPGLVPGRLDAPMLSNNELKTMLNQCLKLASENKITSANTWSLPLIEHMDDLIKTEAGAETEAEATNFQRASVTLDAGIKIYGYRVDSVHNETYKILGGLGRSSAPEEGAEGGGQDPGSTPSQPKQRPRPLSSLDPSSTLETSPEALNAKRVDQGPEPDPLFHRMRAQFDRGGPSALLLNNLSVLRGCEVVFDSHASLAALARDAALPAPPDSLAALKASPEACAALQALREARFVGPGMPGLSPPLDQIWAMARGPAEPARRAAEQIAIQAIADELLERAEDDQRSEDVEPEESSVEQMTDGDGMAWESQTALSAAEWDAGADDAPDSHESGASSAPALTRLDPPAALDAETLGWLTCAGDESASPLARARGAGSARVLRAMSKNWAAASHWRFQAPATEAGADEGAAREAEGCKRPRGRAASARVRMEPVDFVARMREPPPEYQSLAPAEAAEAKKGRKAKKLGASEDGAAPLVAFDALDLFRFALRPRTFFLRSSRQGQAPARHLEPAGSGMDAAWDDSGAWGDLGEAFGALALSSPSHALDLAPEPERLQREDVACARLPTVVDVKELKALVWRGAREARKRNSNAPVRFEDVLGSLPEESAAGALEDLSTHLCFICVLHLANEHGLRLRAAPSLDVLDIEGMPE